MLRIRAQPGIDDRRIDAVAPVAGHEIDLEAQPRRHIAPERRKVAGLEHEHAVAGGERVHQCGLPRAGARRRIDDDRAACLEDSLKPFDHLVPERRELWTTMIDGRPRDRVQHALGHVGRPGDLQKVTSAFDGHSE